MSFRRETRRGPGWQGARGIFRRAVWGHTAQGKFERNAASAGHSKSQQKTHEKCGLGDCGKTL